MNAHVFKSLALAAALAACKPSAQPATQPAPATSARNTPASSGADSSAALDASVPSAAAGSTMPARPVPLYAGQAVEPSRWNAGCAANRTCPDVPAIARCGSIADTRDVAAAYNDRATLVGQRIAVRGVLLGSAGCTEMGCPDRACCNGCFGYVYLASANRRGAEQSSFAFADPEVRDGPFSCRGDDSAICCNFAADGRTVVVQATLTRIRGTYVLSQPELCEP
ncbi:MAG: hypothetical protein JNK05_09215 [Myxococcales bacterium]|nr:hypothetical protein [Myxococcales bacterium]